MIETLRSLAIAAGHDMPAVQKRDDNPAATPGDSLENPRTSFDRVFDIEPSYSGVRVSEISSLRLASVWRCVNLIAGTVARTPFLPYYRTESSRTIARTHYLWSLLMVAANPYLTAYRFKRMMQTWLLLWGNAYAEIEENGRGQIIALWPWRPDRVRVYGSATNLFYEYTNAVGETRTVPAYQMLHIRGLETDGIKGLSPIMSARQSVGLAIAAEEYGARFFGNNGRPGGVLEHPAKVSPQAAKNILETWNTIHRGLQGAHKVGILEEGMKYHEVGVNPEDMQFLEIRQFQTVDIARLFGVPPHMVAELDKATFSNIEHQSIEFVNGCMDDWFCNWEHEVPFSLLSTTESKSVETKFYRQKLLMGDMKTRNESRAIARSWGALTANEWREEEGLNPRSDPDGDAFLMPLNYVVAGSDSPEPTDPDDTDPDENTPAVTPEPKEGE